MVTKLASGELVFSSSLATGLTILLKLAEINTCFNGKCCTGETTTFTLPIICSSSRIHVSKCWHFFLYLHIITNGCMCSCSPQCFPFAGMPLFQINVISASRLLLHALHDDFLSFLTYMAEHHRQLNVVTKLFGKP